MIRYLPSNRALGVLIALASTTSSLCVPVVAKETSAAPASGDTALYSPDSDAQFAQPYIDIDEWRDAPVRHRYVHGGFAGTNTRFSFYFPPKEQYQGRFFQHITPFPISENLAQAMPAGQLNKIGSTLDSGAYFVETNGGGAFDLGKLDMGRDPTVSAYKANAAAAAYSRKVAIAMYGGKRPYGYAYGGSGGGYRTIGAIENTQGVWDGVVPYVIGSTMAIPNMFTARMQAMRVLRDKFPQIVDAMQPGGSGDPYAGLNEVEAAALREATALGFPPQSWFSYKTMGIHGFAALYGGVVAADPSYFTDFWTKPGYLGFDHPELFTRDRIQFTSTVAKPITAAELARINNANAAGNSDRGGVNTAFKEPEGAEGQKVAAFRLSPIPPAVYFNGGDLIIKTGQAAGKRITLAKIVGDMVEVGVADSSVVAQIAAGDEVQIDNSNFLAMETYHRHQVPGPDFKVWDAFRKPDGSPMYPQRRMLLGPMFVKATAGSLQTGRFRGKMIVVSSLWDREAAPWQADWYRSRVVADQGAKADSNFRLWYTDHALHGDEAEQAMEAPDRIVGYVPILQQALRDLAAWAEKGIAPPRSTQYTVDAGRVTVPADAAQRHGVQPVVSLSVNGGKRVEVNAGATVTLAGSIAVPPGAGKVVAAGWDFSGTGNYVGAPVAAGRSRVTVRMTHRFDRPGTYFVGLKGYSQRNGNTQTPYARIENVDQVRVVVK